MTAITALTATALQAALRSRALSAREVMQACLARIGACNPVVNALVSLQDEDRLLQQADRLDGEVARGAFRGPLHGIPHAVKDLSQTAGIRTTMGSRLFADTVPQQDDLHVARLRAAGAILIGKTNVPEFGLGSHTTNPVFGPTRNAYDPSRSAGGSSGGAAVALAMRMVPLADGSDFGGSLRNPAGWNNVFGFRPSAGRVPKCPAPDIFFQQFGYEGPMARTVRDLGLLLSVQAGYDPAAPLSLRDDPGLFAGPLDRDCTGLRVGWLGDMGGSLPMEPGVLALCTQALQALSAQGMIVEEAAFPVPEPEIWQCWLTLRHWSVGNALRPLYDDPAKRAQLGANAVWEVEGSLSLTGQALYDATRARTRIYHAFQRLFETYDVLALPTAQLFPFDVTQPYPAAIAGTAMETYHRWMEVNFAVTLSGCPSVAVPAGFGGAANLPMGLQLVGPYHHDLALLQTAHAYEQASPWQASPRIARLPPSG